MRSVKLLILCGVALTQPACKTTHSESGLRQDAGPASGYLRVWHAFRRADGTPPAFQNDLARRLTELTNGDLARHGLDAYLALLAPSTIIGEEALGKKVPDAFFVEVFRNADAYESDKEATGNALNAEHWQALAAGKTKQVAAEPATSSVQPNKAYLIHGPAGVWAQGFVTGVLLARRLEPEAHLAALRALADDLVESHKDAGLDGALLLTGREYGALLLNWQSSDKGAGTWPPNLSTNFDVAGTLTGLKPFTQPPDGASSGPVLQGEFGVESQNQP